MNDDLRARADARLEAALAGAPWRDPRPFFRPVLKHLKDRDPAGFERAIDHFQSTLIPAVAGDGDPLAEWLEYGRLLATLGIAAPPEARGGLLDQTDRGPFGIDLDNDTVTCPNRVVVPIRRNRDGDGTANFGKACTGCPLAAQCTTGKTGRKVAVSRVEGLLARARAAGTDPARRADYQATRPKVERKLAHLMRHRHGGRRARMRGRTWKKSG